MSTDWTFGYTTDVPYTQGFYRELTPAYLSFLALVSGRAAPSAGASLTYCELGFGQGLSINVHAAANPHIQFYANDFNPTHVAGAEALARAAQLSNVCFSDRGFADYVDDPELPEAFDIICLHGIYSWISPENRAHIVDFLSRKLKVGGLCFVSYNCQPGWAAAAPLRHLMHAHGAISGGATLSRLDPALAFADRLKSAGSAYFRTNPGLAERLTGLQGMDRRYLAHEYMNDAWELLWSSQVADEFRAAKLSFVTTAHLPDRIDSITFTAEGRALLSDIADPTFKELVKDYLQNQQFRRDMFIKGPVVLPGPVLAQAWDEQSFVLSSTRQPDDLRLQTPLGEVRLRPEIYGTVLGLLAAGPSSVGQLRQHRETQGFEPGALREALILLTGLGKVQPVLSGGDATVRAESTTRFNNAVLNRSLSGGDIGWLASPVTGGGVLLGRFEQLFLKAELDGAGDAVAAVAGMITASGEKLVKDGAAVDDVSLLRSELAKPLEAYTAAKPILSGLGVI